MKTNKEYLIFTIFAFSLMSFSNEKINCDKLKNGKYYYYLKKTREKTLITRTDSLQIETNEFGKDVMKNKIIWTGNCKYDMYLNAFSDTKLDATDSLIALTPSHVEITHIDKTFYICTAKMNIFNKTLNFTDTIYFMK